MLRIFSRITFYSIALILCIKIRHYLFFHYNVRLLHQLTDFFMTTTLSNTLPNLPSLPIIGVMEDVITALSNAESLVLEASPGAGKTTLVPLLLLQQPWLRGQKILMLEPRRLAARGAAERMAGLLGETVGETVGYRVRLDSKVGPNTRIEVITEGVLTRLLQDDPVLENVGLVIFDEFHERHMDGDLGLTLCLHGQQELGDLRESPLKILVMSATLATDDVSKFLGGASIIRSTGRSFPVDIRYLEAFEYGENIVPRTVKTIKDVVANDIGDVLVFLPGQGEIRRVAEQLNTFLSDLSQDESILIAPLFGDLSLEEQRRAISPANNGERKIVLATSIAESSLTIEGVRVVVDAGLTRAPVFNSATGMASLITQRVSRAAATQRAGRAGRVAPGICYRLWSATQQDSLAEYSPVEIVNADLAPMALQLMQWGVSDINELPWLTKPNGKAFERSVDLLRALGAVDGVDPPTLTDHGQRMLALPMHPRLAHLMLQAQQWVTDGHQVVGNRMTLIELAACLAALLSERDILVRNRSDSGPLPSDLMLRLRLVLGIKSDGQTTLQHAGKNVLARIKTQAQHYLRRLAPIHSRLAVEDKLALDVEDWAGVLLSQAYPDRIAATSSVNGTNYQLANGKRCELSEADSLMGSQYLVVAQLYGGASSGSAGARLERIGLATALAAQRFQDLLKPQIFTDTIVHWDEALGRLVAEKQEKLGKLVISRAPLATVTSSEKLPILLDMVKRRGLVCLPWSEPLKHWLARVRTAQKLVRDCANLKSLPDADAVRAWPDFSDEGLLANLAAWLGPFLEHVTSAADIQKLDLDTAVKSQLDWQQQQWLNHYFPPVFAIPSGRDASINYLPEIPVLAVKLQEMFGCQTTPCVANGVLPLQIHLLSPAGRPLQVTQDLAGFWRGAYHDVKKDMKGRYPKHPWPDDPLSFEATAKTKRRLSGL